VLVAGALLVAVAASVLARVGQLHAGLWIDEGIAVGIASHPLGDIPALLREDGSPPLYYLVLHGWMLVAGDGEAAVRSLSLVFAAAAVPVSWWAANALGGRRAGLVAAALAAGCPAMSHYAVEARMYTLVALLSLVATAAFVLAFVRGRRGHLVTLVVALVLLLYAHTWGVFLAAAVEVAAARLDWRRAAVVAGAVAVGYAPWVPSLVFQALHTGAPWSRAPSMVVLAALIAPAVLAWRASPVVRVLAAVAAVGVALAWGASQVEPAWSGRYLAVLYGPAALALACGVARRPPWVATALVVAMGALLVAPLPAKSNVRAVAVSAGIGLRPGDVVVSTQPEQVPVLARYLPRGVRFVTPLGTVADPSVMDWRDALPRLRAAAPPRLAALEPGRRVVLVWPVLRARSVWARAVRRATRAWRAALRGDPRLASVGATSRPGRFRSTVRAEIFVVTAAE
jgi:hypothetical protein